MGIIVAVAIVPNPKQNEKQKKEADQDPGGAGDEGNERHMQGGGVLHGFEFGLADMETFPGDPNREDGEKVGENPVGLFFRRLGFGVLSLVCHDGQHYRRRMVFEKKKMAILPNGISSAKVFLAANRQPQAKRNPKRIQEEQAS